MDILMRATSSIGIRCAYRMTQSTVVRIDLRCTKTGAGIEPCPRAIYT